MGFGDGMDIWKRGRSQEYKVLALEQPKQE